MPARAPRSGPACARWPPRCRASPRGGGVRGRYPHSIARLGDTDLDVFPLCLGGNVFGWTLDEEGSYAVLDAYVEGGGNFIDTADIYARRGPLGIGGSERIIGSWLAARGGREGLVIATKVGMSSERPGLSREAIMRGAEDSLGRLGSDCIDLYYAHQDDGRTPLQETLAAFAELIADGRVRYVAASNYSAARLAQALSLGAEREELASYVALQPHYNLVERDYEREFAPLCERNGLACIPYFGLARGFLTGKYRRDGAEVHSPRAAGVRESYCNERGFDAVEALDEVAAAHGVAPATIALAWLRSQPTVLAPIASATSSEQLAELMPSATLELASGELDRLSAASG